MARPCVAPNGLSTRNSVLSPDVSSCERLRFTRRSSSVGVSLLVGFSFLRAYGSHVGHHQPASREVGHIGWFQEYWLVALSADHVNRNVPHQAHTKRRPRPATDRPSARKR